MKRNIDSFLEYMVVIRGASENTIAAYRRDLTQFAAAMAAKGAVEPAAVTEEMLADYFFALEKSGAARTTQARHTSSVRAFYRFLVENDDVQRNIADILERPKYKREIPVVLSLTEIDRLLAAPDPGAPMGTRDRAILELLYASGLKVGELIVLKPDDIDLRSAIVRVGEAASREGKTAMERDGGREIPFGEKARDALLDWIGKGRERYVPIFTAAPLFVNARGTGLTRQSIWKLVKRYGRAAGIRQEVTPGMLRHSFAAHLMANGADLRSLTRMMGYAAQTQAAIYETGESARLRDVYARAQKRG